MCSDRRNAGRGFTMVELMITVAIVGVLAALAVYGVRAHLMSAKTAEAKQALGAIGRGAVSAYERTADTHAVCGSAIPVPATVPKGNKYQPNSAIGVDFGTGNSVDGWQCLMFTITNPIYYRYTYVAGNTGLTATNNQALPTADGFEAAAQGDLDGDGAFSTFALVGSTTSQGIRLAAGIYVEEEGE